MKYEEILKQVSQNTGSAFFYTPNIYENAKSYIFKKPHRKITVEEDNIEEVLNEVDLEISNGAKAYALLNYEAGYLFEKKLQHFLDGNEKDLVQFYLFGEDQAQEIDTDEIEFEDFENCMNGVEIKNFKLNVSEREYLDAIGKVKDYISEGETYQVNYTVKGKFDLKGEVTNLFSKLIFNQSARYSALINTGDRFVLSISPELFFELEGNRLSTKPMKGTIKRGITNSEDKLKEKELFNSKKDRAENIMITDLLRNDLGRVAKIGTVEASQIYNVEKYESVFQMTSKVSCEVEKVGIKGVLKNIFPCGSITGAPKLRTMEIIHELEKEKRGIYTGAIGIISKEKSVFNVPIRTIEIDKKSKKGEIGIGSGVVWGSDPRGEYEETKLKANFLTRSTEYFELFETLLWDGGEFFLLDDHVKRLGDASDYFLFKFDKDKTIRELENHVVNFDPSKKYRVKLVLNKWGNINITSGEYIEDVLPKKITISKIRRDKNDKFTFFKTTKNSVLYEERELNLMKGFFETVFLNQDGELTEGAISNIFIKKDGTWYTPPISCGLLAGCYRKVFMDRNNVEEKILYVEDLDNADRIVLTNSVRGEVEVGRRG